MFASEVYLTEGPSSWLADKAHDVFERAVNAAGKSADKASEKAHQLVASGKKTSEWLARRLQNIESRSDLGVAVRMAAPVAIAGGAAGVGGTLAVQKMRKNNQQNQNPNFGPAEY